MTLTLYPDQSDLTARIRRAMGAGHRSVLMQSATGSGKTMMAMDMMLGAVGKGSTAWFTVPRVELMIQTMETMLAHDVPFSTIAPGFSYNPMSQVHLAMTPTLARRLDKLKPPKVAFIDETHFGGADLDRIIRWLLAGGSRVVGLSATPMKTNGKAMGDWYEHMEEGLQIGELIRLRRLSQFRYFAPSAPDLSGLRVSNGDYVHSQIAELMEHETAIIGDAVQTYKDRAAGKLCVVFATSRKHAEMIREAFCGAGVPAMTIDGTMDKDTRKRIVMGFARREFTVLVNVALLTFGFDLAQAAQMPVRIEALMDLCPRKSLPLQMQVWGRALRIGPEPAVIMDHANNWREHGFPDSPREWSLEGAKKRGPSGEKSEPIRQCSIADGGCGFVHRPAPVCPNCGRVYEIKSRMVAEVDGYLVEIDREAITKIRRQEQGMSKDLNSLILLGKSKGYARPDLWAKKVMAGREAKLRRT